MSDIKSKVDAATGRLLAGSVAPGLLEPGIRIKPDTGERLKQDIKLLTPEKIRYELGNTLSYKDRSQNWKDDTRSFEEKNKEWNDKFWSHIKQQAQDQQTKETLRWVDIDVDNEDNDNGLNKGVENFRQKYVAKEATNIEGFVEDIAKNCHDNEGNVDLGKLEGRMSLLKDKGILNAFGKTDEVKTLIEKYGKVNGLISQNEDKKAVVAEATVAHTSDYVQKGTPERDFLDKVYKQYKDITSQPVPSTETNHGPSVEEVTLIEASSEPAIALQKDQVLVKKDGSEITIVGIDDDKGTVRLRHADGKEHEEPKDSVKGLIESDFLTVKSSEEEIATEPTTAPESSENVTETIVSGEQSTQEVTDITAPTDNADRQETSEETISTEEPTQGGGLSYLEENKAPQIGVGTPVNYLEIPGKVMNVYDDGTVLLEIGGETYPKPIAINNPNLKW